MKKIVLILCLAMGSMSAVEDTPSESEKLQATFETFNVQTALIFLGTLAELRECIKQKKAVEDPRCKYFTHLMSELVANFRSEIQSGLKELKGLAGVVPETDTLALGNHPLISEYASKIVSYLYAKHERNSKDDNK